MCILVPEVLKNSFSAWNIKAFPELNLVAQVVLIISWNHFYIFVVRIRKISEN